MWTVKNFLPLMIGGKAMNLLSFSINIILKNDIVKVKKEKKLVIIPK